MAQQLAAIDAALCGRGRLARQVRSICHDFLPVFFYGAEILRRHFGIKRAKPAETIRSSAEENWPPVTKPSRGKASSAWNTPIGYSLLAGASGRSLSCASLRNDEGGYRSFVKMMVPDAANMPPTPWHTEILAPEPAPARCRASAARSPAGRTCRTCRNHVAEAAAIGVERQLAAGPGVAVGDEFAGLFVRHEAEIADRRAQMRERVVDHQMIDVLMRNAGFRNASGPRP